MDSNGAGDAFASAFLLGWLNGEDPLRCARYGSIAGAHACTVPSTRTGAITRAELLARATKMEPAHIVPTPAEGAEPAADLA